MLPDADAASHSGPVCNRAEGSATCAHLLFMSSMGVIFCLFQETGPFNLTAEEALGLCVTGSLIA